MKTILLIIDKVHLYYLVLLLQVYSNLQTIFIARKHMTVSLNCINEQMTSQTSRNISKYFVRICTIIIHENGYCVHHKNIGATQIAISSSLAELAVCWVLLKQHNTYIPYHRHISRTYVPHAA